MPSIRQQINIAAPARTVWEKLTTAEGLKEWLVDDCRLDARKGGLIVLDTEDDEGNPVEERGMFHELRPTRKIEIVWERNSPGPFAGTRLVFQLARDGSETRVALIHSGEQINEDDENAAAMEADWRRALKGLRSALES